MSLIEILYAIGPETIGLGILGPSALLLVWVTVRVIAARRKRKAFEGVAQIAASMDMRDAVDWDAINKSIPVTQQPMVDLEDMSEEEANAIVPEDARPVVWAEVYLRPQSRCVTAEDRETGAVLHRWEGAAHWLGFGASREDDSLREVRRRHQLEMG